MNILEIAKNRQSTRSYLPRKVDDKTLQQVLEMAHVAPTAANQQPVRLLVVQSEEGLRKLHLGARLYGAPLVIVVCVDESASWKRPYDGMRSGDIDASILCDHMMLGASELGLATLWVCYFDPLIIQKELSIPASLKPIHLLAMGYTEQAPADPDRHSTMRIPMSSLVSYESF